MFLPIGTERPRRRPTLITYWLIGINVVIFMWRELALAGRVPGDGLLARGVLFLSESGSWSIGGGWWQFLSYQFLHAGFGHLFGNMLFLFVFGPPVEDRFGRKWFVAFYLVGGVFAGLAHWVFSGSNPVLGASGSIAAVTGAFLVLFPLVRVRILLFFIIIGIFHIPAWWFICFAVARDLFGQAIGLGTGGIAYGAHLGGYAFGGAISMLLLWTKVLAREPYDLFSIGRQAHRRARYRDIVAKSGGAFLKDSVTTGRVAQPRREHRRETKMADLRAQVHRALSEKRQSEALNRYRALLDEEPKAVLTRDAQHALGAHAYGSGDYSAASVIFELFLERYASDREADEVRLLLAIINARYLNDPSRAKALLNELDESRLTPDHVGLAHSLRDELG